METDEQLLGRSGRDPAAFEPLVERLGGTVFRYLARRAPAAAPDLLSEVWLQADALRSSRVPADLRAALYRVLTTVPGVELTSTRATVLGRPGVALGRLVTVDGQRLEIVIDPRTGEFVGERSVNQDPKLTTETSVRRTLVDQVPAAIRARARVLHCTAAPDGAVTC